MADDRMNILNNLRPHRFLPRFSQLFHAASNVNRGIFNFFRRERQVPVSAAIFPHAAFAFSISVILGFLQVKYQGKDKSPFESHTITISLGVVSIHIYCSAYGIEQRLSSGRTSGMPKWANDTISWCMLVTGSLSVAATASFLLPDSFRPLIFAFFMIPVAAERSYWVYQRCLEERIESNWGWGWIPGQEFFMNIWRPLAHYFAERQQMFPS